MATYDITTKTTPSTVTAQALTALRTAMRELLPAGVAVANVQALRFWLEGSNRVPMVEAVISEDGASEERLTALLDAKSGELIGLSRVRK